MKRNLPHSLLAAAGLTLLLAACNQSAATKVAPATPNVVGTPVPADLVSYASYVYPTFQSSLAEGNDLLGKMRHSHVGDLGNQCTLVGGDFANYRSAVSGTYVPSRANTAYNTAQAGFKLALASMDECGIAADSSSAKQMATAAKDLQKGLSQISQAEVSVQPWYGARS